MIRRVALAAVVATVAPMGAAGDAADAVFRAPDWGLTVRYPGGLTVSTRFPKTYLDAGAWRVSYAAGAGEGTPIVAFALPTLRRHDAGGSSEIDASVRIGASRDPATRATCLSYGLNSGDNVERTHRRIGGLDFVEVPDNGDAAMMNDLRTDDLRAVDGDVCWAIDVVRSSSGTSSTPPAYAPAQLALLQRVLDGISFDRADAGRR